MNPAANTEQELVRAAGIMIRMSASPHRGMMGCCGQGPWPRARHAQTGLSIERKLYTEPLMGLPQTEV